MRRRAARTMTSRVERPSRGQTVWGAVFVVAICTNVPTSRYNPSPSPPTSQICNRKVLFICLLGSCLGASEQRRRDAECGHHERLRIEPEGDDPEHAQQ